MIDSGCTDHLLLRLSDSNDLPLITPIGGHRVNVANNDTIVSIGSAQVMLHPSLPPKTAHIFNNNDLSASLAGVSTFTDDGCTVSFDATSLTISKDDHQLIQVPKSHHERVWTIPLPHSSHANVAIHNTSHAELVHFLSAVMGNPADSTLLTATRNKWLNFPGVTHDMVAKNPPNSIETAKGHLDLNRANQRSTSKPKHPQRTLNQSSPSPEDPSYIDSDENSIFAAPIEFTPGSTTQHSDATGRFPIMSRRRNNYLLVSVYKGYIHLEPFKSRSAGDYVDAYRATIAFFTEHLGTSPSVVRLDNETSESLESFFKDDAKVKWEYVPPNNHRTNKAERSIRTAKNHILATLSGVHSSFPMHLWDDILPQCELTLNHLRPFADNPAISAYDGLHPSAPYDFLAHPLAPIGTLALAFDSPSTRGSWAPHGTRCFYIGPSLDHYRSYRVYCPTTHSIRTADTLAWFPDKVLMPGSTIGDRLLLSIHDMTAHLRQLSLSPAVPPAQRPSFDNHITTASTALHDLHAIYCSHIPLDNAPVQRVEDAPPAQRVAAIPDLPNPPGRLEARIIPDHPPGIPSPTIHTIPAPAETRPVISINPSPYSTQPNTIPPSPAINVPTIPDPPTRRSDRVFFSTLNLTNSLPTAYATSPIVNGPLSLNRVEDPLHPIARLNIDDHGRPLTFQRAMQDSHRSAFEIADAVEFSKIFDTQCVIPIHKHDQPADRRQDTTYYSKQVREKYDETHTYQARVRGVAGGDRITYDGEVSAHVAAMPTVKLFLNAAVSENASLMTLDISDFYLGTPLPRPEYMRIPSTNIPTSILDKYKLRNYLDSKGMLLLQINKTLWGLPQSGLLSKQRLCKHLASHGYHECTLTSGLFRHVSLPIAFTLVVDDFLVKYHAAQDAQHLIDVLTSDNMYKIKINDRADKYLGYNIAYNKTMREIALSMPDSVAKIVVAHCKGVPPPPQLSPARYIPPSYGVKGPQLTLDDFSPTLPLDTIKYIQRVVGALLYYALAVDCTLVPAVTAISSAQAQPTQPVLDALNHLLGYAAANPHATLVFKASDMRLHVGVDGSHLSRPNSRSVAGAFFFVGDTSDPTIINGPVECMSTVIPVVTASAGETEYASLFMAAQKACPLRQTLYDLGYPQPATLIPVDNTCAVGLANDVVKSRRSKSVDMRLHWIRDRVKQGQFKVIWREGQLNLADFFTKPLPTKAFRRLRHFFVRLPDAPTPPAPPSATRTTRMHAWHHNQIVQDFPFNTQ